MYKCSFGLRYTYVEYNTCLKLPLSYFKVKLSWCNYNHTCQLSLIFYNTATCLSRGKVKVNLDSIYSVLMLLKCNHAIYDCSLRPLLTQYVHHDVEIDCNYIRNCMQRVACFHALKPSYTALAISETNTLLNKVPLNEEEHNVLNYPVVRINSKEMLLKVMAEDSSTWGGLAFLRRCKEEIPGFDLRICFNLKTTVVH